MNTYSLPKKKTLTFLAASIFAAAILFPSATYSADKQVEVFVNGQSLSFGEAGPVLLDGRTLVPFRDMFEALGYQVKWDVEEQTAIGERDGYVIELPTGSFIATVGGVETALDVPARILDGKTYVPLRFVSEHSGYEETYVSTTNALKIGVSDGSITEPIPLLPVSQTIVGRVMDEQGNGESGFHVTAHGIHTTNAQAEAVSNEYGYYAIELPAANEKWQLAETYESVHSGITYTGKLLSDTSEPVSASAGGIRNLTVIELMGAVYMELEEGSAPVSEPLSPDDVVLTLSPIGPHPNGRDGETIVKRVTLLDDGIGIKALPIGQYEVTAHYMPPGGIPVPMAVRIKGDGEFHSAITPTFREQQGEGYMMEIEVMPINP
ncbi:copper amine oxidase N-terminal domain-containing protein [Paenibacillus sp. strain BS8-2]